MKFTDAEETFFRRLRIAATLAFLVESVLTALAVKEGRLSFEQAADNLELFGMMSLVAVCLRPVTAVFDQILIALIRPRR